MPGHPGHPEVTKYPGDTEEAAQEEAAFSEKPLQHKNGIGRITLDKLRKMIGCPEGYTGQGVTVAIIDSGVYPHADLTMPHNRLIAFKDFVNHRDGPYDDNGHGTAMAGIMAGNGYSSGGIYQGIAPECNIVAVKALDAQGMTTVSNLARAIDWVCENKDRYNISIVNISIGVHYSRQDYETLAPSIARAQKANLLVIASAGNSLTEDKLFLPAAFSEVLAVGAIEDTEIKDCSQYKVAPFSASQPDLVAPGNFILTLQRDTAPRDAYTLSFGTSNAAAVVSGAAALLKQAHDDASSASMKQLILGRCIRLNTLESRQGQGYLYLAP
jgi:serine protease AprX